MVKIKTQYVCQDCGYSSPRYLGRCPNCGAWNTLVEEVEKPNKTNKKTRVSFSGSSPKPQLIDEVDVQDNPRTTTASVELDRVLGGEIVPGSLILIGGDPGIGKSTLLLQLSGQLAKQELTVLYVSGEESAMQIKIAGPALGRKGTTILFVSRN